MNAYEVAERVLDQLMEDSPRGNPRNTRSANRADDKEDVMVKLRAIGVKKHLIVDPIGCGCTEGKRMAASEIDLSPSVARALAQVAEERSISFVEALCLLQECMAPPHNKDIVTTMYEGKPIKEAPPRWIWQ